jgi:hypothetical protein
VIILGRAPSVLTIRVQESTRVSLSDCFHNDDEYTSNLKALCNNPAQIEAPIVPRAYRIRAGSGARAFDSYQCKAFV